MCSKSPHHIDIVVGQNVRMLRTRVGKTQVDVANALGITFQQIQKYEKGRNRISSSRLYQIADFFGVEIATLFAGTGMREQDAPLASYSAEALAVAKAYEHIRSPKIRRAVQTLLSSLDSVDDVPGMPFGATV